MPRLGLTQWEWPWRVVTSLNTLALLVAFAVADRRTAGGQAPSRLRADAPLSCIGLSRYHHGVSTGVGRYRTGAIRRGGSRVRFLARIAGPIRARRGGGAEPACHRDVLANPSMIP